MLSRVVLKRSITALDAVDAQSFGRWRCLCKQKKALAPIGDTHPIVFRLQPCFLYSPNPLFFMLVPLPRLPRFTLDYVAPQWRHLVCSKARLYEAVADYFTGVEQLADVRRESRNVRAATFSGTTLCSCGQRLQAVHHAARAVA